jgi:hypothetical protein
MQPIQKILSTYLLPFSSPQGEKKLSAKFLHTKYEQLELLAARVGKAFRLHARIDTFSIFIVSVFFFSK